MPPARCAADRDPSFRFTINPLFTDHNADCVVVEDGHSYFMILMRDFFQIFTDLPIGDPAVIPSVATAIFLDSRDAVDKAVADGLAAGGAEPHPASDYGFMYQRQLTDPDGNFLEFGWMDPVAAEQDPKLSPNSRPEAGLRHPMVARSRTRSPLPPDPIVEAVAGSAPSH